MSLHSKQSLHKKLSEPKFREAFVSSRIAQTIATQIRVLRQKKEMSQKDLARELDTSQNAIYRLESPRYGKPNISTLKKLAKFFDVGLVVRFASYSEIADWTNNLTEQSFEVPDFDHDAGFIEHKGPRSEMTPRAQSAQLPRAIGENTITLPTLDGPRPKYSRSRTSKRNKNSY